MQPTVLDIERSGDLGGKKTPMKFDEDSIAHLMSVLTDLYSDAEMAIIREYSTNGLDAQIEAGYTGPLRVYTPSSLSPFFRVIDSGIGMDVTDIEEIYSQYGASTKRGTNEQTGMLGLGCKSALTYTNQFTVVSVKDGMETSVMISRIEDGTGVMEVIFQKPTDKANGTEIVIPVRASSTFDYKVKSFFSYWKEGTVLVNDQQPEFLGGKAKRLGDTDIFMVPGDGDDVLVMGGVPYPVKGGLSGNYGKGYYKRFRVVAVVKIGSVNFTPSREQLHYTHLTEDTVAETRRAFSKAIESTIQKDIDKAETHGDAIKSVLEWQDMVSVGNIFTYRGEVIRTQYTATHHSWDVHASRNALSYDSTETSYKTVMKSLTITGFEFEKVTITQRKKVKRWMEEKYKHFSNVIFVEGDEIGLPWTKGSEVVDYAEIKALRLPAAPRDASARTAKYDVLNDRGYTEETDDIDDSQNIYYYSPTEFKGRGVILRQLFPDDVLVKIGKNRHSKFMRDFPNAKPLNLTVMKKRLTEVFGLLTDMDKIYLSLDNWTRQKLRLNLVAERFDDPELSTYIKAASVTPSDNLALFEKTKKALQEMGHYYLPEMQSVTIKSPFAAYPLATRLTDFSSGLALEHLYLYCNAVYNSKEN